ncbi:MAG: VTT domain-containing protein [Terriglobia bacterium]
MKALTHKIQVYFLALTGPLGGWALLILAFLDSSFLSFPEVNDILIVTLSIEKPNRMLYYALMTTIGSVVGCLLLYWMGRKGGEIFLRKRFAGSQIDAVARWYKKYGLFAVMIPSILPPPTPFKIFVLFAGAFRIALGPFLIAIVIGRGFRYFVEGALAVRYGKEAIDTMRRYYPHAAGIIVGLLILSGVVFYLWQRKHNQDPKGRNANLEIDES